MNRRTLALLWLALFGGVVGAAAHAAERAKADIVCKPTDKRLAYDCAIKLTGRDSGKLLTGATITVGADMPSMPMAHNVRPVVAKEAEPGAYTVRIELEMQGEWTLKLDITGPVRDRLVQKVDFAGEHKH